ncbi:MAG: hypothetical protein RIC55_18910 [Pirellulaceae bacterium]
MNRLHQFLLIGSFLPLCWLGMMAVHELGHVLAAWGTGGGVERVILHPLSFSQTFVAPNPQPMIVVWSGPLVGVTLPLLVWGVFYAARLPGAYLTRFFAGTCLIANGAYIGAGSLGRIGDAGDMLRMGTPMWVLWLFGLLTAPAGMLLWNGLGRRFGLGEARGRVDQRAAYVSASLLIATVATMLLLSK